MKTPRISVVALRGGFGNQLFGWAYGRVLQEMGSMVLWDTNPNLGRGYGLGELILKRNRIWLPTRFWTSSRFQNTNFILTSKYEDPTVPPDTNANSNSLITFHWGYWQSSDYFATIENEIRNELRIAFNLSPNSLKDYCAIHVRRGDYITDSGAAQTIGALPLSYYENSIDLMMQNGHKKFVCYTDDPDWVSRNLIPRFPNILLSQSNSALEDFRGISSAKSVITANSTFSWWGAFATGKTGSDVIAPKKWFSDNKIDSTRLPHPDWTLL